MRARGRFKATFGIISIIIHNQEGRRRFLLQTNRSKEEKLNVALGGQQAVKELAVCPYGQEGQWHPEIH